MLTMTSRRACLIRKIMPITSWAGCRIDCWVGLAPNPICCGRYLRHGFEPVTDQRLLFQSLNFEGNQTHGWFGGEVRLRSENAMLVSRDLLYERASGLLQLQYPSALYRDDVAITLDNGSLSTRKKSHWFIGRFRFG